MFCLMQRNRRTAATCFDRRFGAGFGGDLRGRPNSWGADGRRGERRVRYQFDHKEKTRKQILEAAAAQIRLSGLDGVSIAAIMKGAGLTHGGFYVYFDSKTALTAAAVEFMFDQALDGLAAVEERRGEAALARYVDLYLSPRHRDDVAGGCPVAALMSAVPAASAEVRAAYANGMRRLSSRIADLSQGGDRQWALDQLSQMAGAIAFARAMADRTASATLLSAARERLQPRRAPGKAG
jgi:TetR/AcrR family transcriptional repressor of nem operon